MHDKETGKTFEPSFPQEVQGDTSLYPKGKGTVIQNDLDHCTFSLFENILCILCIYCSK